VAAATAVVAEEEACEVEEEVLEAGSRRRVDLGKRMHTGGYKTRMV
jgi:hypothetical protein